MKIIHTLFLLGCLLIAQNLLATAKCPAPKEQEGHESRVVMEYPQKDTFRILTWNLHLLPTLARPKHQIKRAKAIASLLPLSKYDVLVFQEVFHKKSYRIITEQLAEAYPHQFTVSTGSQILKTSSGVLILSKHPFSKMQSLQFEDVPCECYVSDCMAHKGAALVEIQYGNQPVQIIGTHLQAHEHTKAVSIRNCQIEAIVNKLVIPNQTVGIPQLVTGDMNIARNLHPDIYQSMLRTLGVKDANFQPSPVFTFDGALNQLVTRDSRSFQDILDYMLYNTNGLELAPVVYRVRKFKDTQHKDLSDHYAVETGFIIK